jgi:hypothetical protein
MTESDHVRAQLMSDFIDRAPPVAAAQIAPVVRLIFEQPQRGRIAIIRPLHAARFEIFTERLDGPQKLALFDRESANGELNRGAPRQQQQRFEQRGGIFAAGKSYGHPIPVPDHLKPVHSLADFVEKRFFEIH